MNGFSTSSQIAIESYARTIGVDARGFDAGSVSFAFSRSGTLSFTAATDGSRVLISLARQPAYAEEAQELALLSRAGFDPASNAFVHAGQSDDGWLVASMSFDERELDASTIESAFQQLSLMLGDAGVR